MTAIRVEASFFKKLDALDEKLERRVRDRLDDMAEDATRWSTPFVDTGAFIMSWQISSGRGRPRGRSSHGLPRKQNKEQKRLQSLAQLYADIDRIDLKNTTRIVLRNGAPHARYVDIKHSHVQTQLRNKYG